MHKSQLTNSATEVYSIRKAFDFQVRLSKAFGTIFTLLIISHDTIYYKICIQIDSENYIKLVGRPM